MTRDAYMVRVVEVAQPAFQAVALVNQFGVSFDDGFCKIHGITNLSQCRHTGASDHVLFSH